MELTSLNGFCTSLTYEEVERLPTVIDKDLAQTKMIVINN